MFTNRLDGVFRTQLIIDLKRHLYIKWGKIKFGPSFSPIDLNIPCNISALLHLPKCICFLDWNVAKKPASARFLSKQGEVAKHVSPTCNKREQAKALEKVDTCYLKVQTPFQK